MKELMIAIGLLLFFEGVAYGGFPNQLKKYAAFIAKMPIQQIRITGFVAMFIGLIIVWLIV